MLESAGLPLPGETRSCWLRLPTGTGQLSLPLVIAVAAVAAIVGDAAANAGGRGGQTTLGALWPYPTDG